MSQLASCNLKSSFSLLRPPVIVWGDNSPVKNGHISGSSGCTRYTSGLVRCQHCPATQGGWKLLQGTAVHLKPPKAPKVQDPAGKSRELDSAQPAATSRHIETTQMVKILSLELFGT